jgi:putative ABC transport system ATP-binding protein
MLDVVHLGRRSATGDWLLRDVSFAVGPGERVGVSGPSGSGKSVLLRALALLEAADAGEIRWRGTRVQGGAVPAFRREVMYLHQRPVIVQDATVRANLRLPFTLREHRSRAFDEGRIRRWLDLLGRGHGLLDRPARYLSGGEAQLVALLRAIQLQPTMLLLDEPTAALDEATTTRIEQLVDAFLREDDRRAMVWISHDGAQLDRMTTRRVLVRAGGKTTAEGAA